jgi:DNA-binding Lrp family transcriptional regulator
MDRIDFEILRVLSQNARLSNKELAEIVGLSASTCLERVRKLRAEGVVRGFYAELSPIAMGVGLEALIAIRLRRHSRAIVEAFRAHALSLDEVVSVYHVAGGDDFQVHVAVRDANHLRDLAMDAFTTRPEVAHIRTSLIYSHARAAVLPMYTEPDDDRSRGPRERTRSSRR